MRVVLCGDFVPTAATVPTFEAGDKAALLGSTLPVIQGADYAVANLECALTDRDTPIRKCGPNLKGKPEYAKVMAEAGFTHLGLSNNHVFDFGEQAMRDTASAVAAAGMTPFGYGENDQDSRKPLIIEKDGKRLAIVAVCEHEYSYALPDRFGANPFDPFDTMEDIAEAKSHADWVVVMYHGGKEQCEYPSPRLRKACRAMARAGADLILTQHSHCIGCRERYRGAEIVYGQGNFNFVKYMDHPHWHSGLMLDVRFGETVEVIYLPVVAGEQGVTLAEGEEKAQILAGFEGRSASLLDSKTWLAEWEAFCRSKPYYIDAIKNAYVNVPEGEQCSQVFSSYLQCEAHLDVWQTLYQNWHGEKSDETGR